MGTQRKRIGETEVLDWFTQIYLLHRHGFMQYPSKHGTTIILKFAPDRYNSLSRITSLVAAEQQTVQLE